MTALAVVGDENLTNVDFYDSCTKNYSLPDALITCSLIFLIKISNKEADENSTYHRDRKLNAFTGKNTEAEKRKCEELELIAARKTPENFTKKIRRQTEGFRPGVNSC
ncbi:uncharacterized protein [Eurosta solidaginis]|uniref:uncharacterized protein isoform X1 n=1 Tax=Eurosta solidaginis TaxID=178769 RepID=UPI00353120DA